MDEQEVRLLRRADLAFFGAIMAGQSHEVTNVFTIINEYVGLGEDLLAAGAGEPCDAGRLRDLMDKIRRQALRGESIIRIMNRFAHTVDEAECVFDVREALEQIAYLAGRPARLGRIELETDFPAESVLLEMDPFAFREAVFTCLKLGLDSPREGRRVVLRCAAGERDVEITVESEDPFAMPSGAENLLHRLRLLVRDAGGAVAEPPGGAARSRISIRFPFGARVDAAQERKEGHGG